MTDTALQELADAGALCGDCGGLHVGKVETAITALHAADETGTKLPWCSCPDCPLCRDFREGLRQFMADNSLLDTTPHCEDAL
jgi:hypothetical protein